MKINRLYLISLKKVSHILTNSIFILLSFGFAMAQLPSQDPGHKEDAEVVGIKFSVPNGFKLEKSPDSRIAFMRHETYDLALFVAVPDKPVDDKYLINLSNTLVSQILLKEKDFQWKIMPTKSASKVSKFQIGGGNTKGFNGKRYVQTDYITAKVTDSEVLVGYITPMGRDIDAKYLFDLKGPGGFSMPGWYAQAHILASVTGEKYEEINPGTSIKGTPVKKN